MGAHTATGTPKPPSPCKKVTINPRQLAFADENGDWILEKGTFTIFVGGGQPGVEGVLAAQLEMIGETFRLR